MAHEDAILADIARENRHFENDRGLAEYLDDGPLKEKVHSLHPSVEVHDGELWGVRFWSSATSPSCIFEPELV